MDKQILNNLNIGEHICEMQEYILHKETVIKTTVYTCKKRLFRKYFDTFEIPFYFKSKELAIEFLKYWDEFEWGSTTYWDNKEKFCYGINHINGSKCYIMVDDYKLRNSQQFSYKCQLTENGVWGGIICTDGRYYTNSPDNVYYTKIFELESLPIETNKTYMFKMIK